MKKVLVLNPKSLSSWKSCQKITSSIEWCYDHLETDELHIQSYQYDLSEACTQEILSMKADLIVFISNSFFTVPLLKRLIGKISSQFLIHLFGDFISHADEWLTVLQDASISKTHVRLFTHSIEETGKIAELVGPDNVTPIFFPLESDIGFNLSDRMRIRKQFQIADDEFVFIYAGRISQQKNVDKLSEVFHQVVRMFPSRKFRFLILGDFDNYAVNFQGGKIIEGYLYQKVSAAFENLPVTFAGEVELKDVSSFLSASDAFISLSLYHSEDFGLGAAEALAHGLPCFLTRWGGYGSFSGFNPYFFETRIENLGYVISCDNLKEYLDDQLNQFPRNEDDRISSGADFLKVFGQQSFCEKVIPTLVDNQPIATFKLDKLKDYATTFVTHVSPGRPSRDRLTLTDNLYYDVFKHYASPEGKSFQMTLSISWSQDFEVSKEIIKRTSAESFAWAYVGHHNPCFLNDKLYQLYQSEGREIILRDGTSIHEQFQGKTCQHTLHADLALQISATSYYQVVSRHAVTACEKLILVIDQSAWINASFLSDKAWESIEVYITKWDDDFQKLLSSKLPSKDIKIAPLENLFFKKDFKGYEYKEVLDSEKVKDSFMLHFALSRRAAVETKDYSLKETGRRRLSLNHELIIYAGK